MYPERIRQWIRANGGLHQGLIYLRGRQLAALYPVCSPGLERGGEPERARATTSRARYAGHGGHALSAMRPTLKREHAAASAFPEFHDGPHNWH
jgi:hypothetical protein